MQKINIYDLWQSLMSEVNVQQNGQIRPKEDFEAWVNKLNMKFFRDRVATDELSQLYADDLAPFRERASIHVVPKSGMPYDLVPYPPNYQGFANMKILRSKEGQCFCEEGAPIYTVGEGGQCVQVPDQQYAEMLANYRTSQMTETTINKVDVGRWGSCLSHPTKGPTFNSPKATQSSEGFYIAPKNLSVVVLDYYRTPQDAIFGYTYSSEDIVIYDPATSQQLEWNVTMRDNFISELKKIYAAHVGDPSIFQMAAAESQNSV